MDHLQPHSGSMRKVVHCVRYLCPLFTSRCPSRRIAVCRPDSLAGTNQGPMGEDIEPMIDQEMFLQMMESMDKDGDGTVTKARP